MKILAIETSTEYCSVALQREGDLLQQSQLAPKQHSRLIMPMVDQLLKEGLVQLNQLDAIAFSAGPGSFTGIRLVAGIAQGLAYGANLPVIPISTLAALAQGAYRQFSATRLLPALDARMHELYWGCYRVQEGFVQPIREDQLIDPHQIEIPEGENWFGVGNGWLEYGEILKAKMGEALQKVNHACFPEAQDVLVLAKREFESGHFVKAQDVLPVYLREHIIQTKT